MDANNELVTPWVDGEPLDRWPPRVRSDAQKLLDAFATPQGGPCLIWRQVAHDDLLPSRS
jgi:hypothetical protein